MVHMKWNSDGMNGNLRAADETRLNGFFYDVNKTVWKSQTKHTWWATCATVGCSIVVEGTSRAGVAQRTPSNTGSTITRVKQTKQETNTSCKRSWDSVCTLCSSHGCRANTVVVQIGADKSLCCMAGRLQETDTAQRRNSTNTSRYLQEKETPQTIGLSEAAQPAKEKVARGQGRWAYCCRTVIQERRAHKWKCWRQCSLRLYCWGSRESQSQWSHLGREWCWSQQALGWSDSVPCLRKDAQMIQVSFLLRDSDEETQRGPDLPSVDASQQHF